MSIFAEQAKNFIKKDISLSPGGLVLLRAWFDGFGWLLEYKSVLVKKINKKIRIA